jgi:capsid protein
MVAYRTGLAEFVLDQLNFIECKLKEARDNPASQKGAVIEAGGAVPQTRERLWSEDKTKATQCLLAFRPLVDSDATAWWTKLAEMDREQFLQEVASLLGPEGPIAAARLVLSPYPAAATALAGRTSAE